MTRPGTISGLLAALAFTIAALAQNFNYQPDPRWRAPGDDSRRSNPLAAQPEALGGGRKLFLRHCAQCHAQDGHGLKRAANLQLPIVQSQTDGALFWKITNGNRARGMPSWSRLPETQRWQLVMFVRTLPKSVATGQ